MCKNAVCCQILSNQCQNHLTKQKYMIHNELQAKKTFCQISLKKRVKKIFPLSVVRWLLSADQKVKSIISIFQVSPKLGNIPFFCYTFAYGVLRKPKRIPTVFFELPFRRPEEYERETLWETESWKMRIENWELWQTRKENRDYLVRYILSSRINQ